MSMKNKTIAAAALAALTLPGAALADGSDRAAEAHKKNSERKAQKKSHGPKAKAFVVKGVDASGLTVTDGALAGSLTLDPTSANKHARRALELTKTELAGEDTVSFGEAGDKVLVNYVGLTSTDTLAPTDVVKVIGKVNREGELNIRKITVTRESATETETETEKQS
jgi:hypothetical protein